MADVIVSHFEVLGAALSMALTGTGVVCLLAGFFAVGRRLVLKNPQGGFAQLRLPLLAWELFCAATVTVLLVHWLTRVTLWEFACLLLGVAISTPVLAGAGLFAAGRRR
ncbi:hypothetical protein [Methylibium rhizosphaerae]|uniref:hypothetical protein n=1 Tax=Methylibium rhizosphaerae TaxID=2570323 RepID=UPI00112EA36E|nr:hypothetical protein [Methylibium rhizosphaerae]